MKLLLLINAIFSYELSTWMSDLQTTISSRKIYQLDIPGAHHAGYLKTRLWLPFFSRFAICQTQTITELLNDGIRWLDLRIGEDNGELYFAHTFRSKQKVLDGLQEIYNWVSSNNEIVILDLNVDSGYRYYGRQTTETALLLGKIESLFGKLVISRNEYASKTIGQLVATNKRVLLTGSLAEKYDIPCRNSWSDTNNGNWGKLVDNIVSWISNQGALNINAGYLSLSSASVTPKFRQDLSPPRRVSRKTCKLMESKITSLQYRLGIISMDFVCQDTTRRIVEHNESF